jgi:3',5'-cyclic AMP phosphodiesterase CpdA
MNRYYFTLAVLVLLVGFTACNKTPSVSSDGSRTFQEDQFRFVVAADPHLFRGPKVDFDKAIELINRLDPEFVVVCGDLIETPADQDQIDAYKDSVSKLTPDIALYNVAGNHDLGRPAKIENIRVYEQHFGELWYFFEHGNRLFIVLSSDILQNHNLAMNKQQIQWLVELLEQSQSGSKKQIFIFMHHPLYLNSPDEPDAYSNMPFQIRRELLDLFVKHNVQAVFSGHYHNNNVNCFKGVDLITTNSITVPMGNAPAAGFRLVEVSQDRYDQQYFTLEELEKKEAIQ